MFIKRNWILIAISILVLLALGLLYSNYKNSYKRNSGVTIILSPHYDDAVLSLGGLLAKGEHPAVVASFFTFKPQNATSTDWDTHSGFKEGDEVEHIRKQENDRALAHFGVTVQNYDYSDVQYRRDTQIERDTLRLEIARDIQSLIASYGDKTIAVYAPAIFNKNITHVDHELVHNAFLDVAKNYPSNNVNFYVYEDYPYVERYNKEVFTSLQSNLEKDSGLLFDKEVIMLSEWDVRGKIRALREYTSQIKAFADLKTDIVSGSEHYTKTRCGSNPATACEVVYKIVRF